MLHPRNMAYLAAGHVKNGTARFDGRIDQYCLHPIVEIFLLQCGQITIETPPLVVSGIVVACSIELDIPLLSWLEGRVSRSSPPRLTTACRFILGAEAETSPTEPVSLRNLCRVCQCLLIILCEAISTIHLLHFEPLSQIFIVFFWQ